jgi:lambda repressor-like predicted transcriptional regulator
MSGDRTYQAALIAAINAEMGGLGLSRRQMLARAGLSENTMERVFRLQRDLNVTQIEAMANAMGVTPEYIAARAAEWRTKGPDGNPGSHPDDEAVIDASTKLTKRQREQAKKALKDDPPGITQMPSMRTAGESVRSSVRRPRTAG